MKGVYPFAGRGVFDLAPLNDALSYTVPQGKSVEVIYFRAGNSPAELIYVAQWRDGNPMRLSPMHHRHEACCTVQGGAVVVPVAPLGHASVQSHTDPQGRLQVPRLGVGGMLGARGNG